MELPEILTASHFHLQIELDGSTLIDGYFLECKGFKLAADLVEIAEVTPGGRVVRTKIPGNLKTGGNLTLRRGMTNSETLWEWFSIVQQGQWAKKRTNGALIIYNQSANRQTRFEFEESWPVSYVVADVRADSGELEIEELVVAYSLFNRVDVG